MIFVTANVANVLLVTIEMYTSNNFMGDVGNRAVTYIFFGK